MASLVHGIYTRLLSRYRQNQTTGAPLFNRVFEQVITWSAAALMQWQGFAFPERATGGWWWISRYRFEFLMGWLDAESLLWCDRLVRPGMTVIDIGAHLGLYTRRLSRLVGPDGRVLAFEANPENFAILRHNLRGYGNVELFHQCVTDRDGMCTLHISPGHSNHSLLAGFTASESTAEIPGVALDSLLARLRIEQVGFIKSDTEGAEPAVISGMPRLLSRAPQPTLLLEFNPAAIRCGPTEPDEFLAGINRLGFQVHAIAADGSLGPIPEMTGSEYCNILCVPNAVAPESSC